MRDWLDRGQVFVAEVAGGVCGFAEAGRREFCDGCATSPVAYLEGWWGDEAARGRGVGRALVAAIEAWARSEGLRELGSDAEIDNEVSQRAHEAIGFEAVGRVVVYRKVLG